MKWFMIFGIAGCVSDSVTQRLRVKDQIFRRVNSLKIFVHGSLVLWLKAFKDTFESQVSVSIIPTALGEAAI